MDRPDFKAFIEALEKAYEAIDGEFDLGNEHQIAISVYDLRKKVLQMQMKAARLERQYQAKFPVSPG